MIQKDIYSTHHSLSNYSYLERMFSSQNSQPSQICHITEDTAEDICDLLAGPEGKILLSHSSIHSEFPNLCNVIGKKFSSIEQLDLRNIDSYGKIKELCFKQKGEDFLLLFSVFGQRFQRYAPALLALLNKVENQKIKVVIYCDFSQQNSIINITQSKNLEFFVVDFCLPRPFQISKGNILEELKKFLVEESKQPNKFDVVLFHPKSQNLIRTISHMLKTEGIFSTTQLIFSPGKTLDRDLSNVIIVNNTQTLMEWEYSLSSVYLVLDSRKQSRMYFNYDFVCYVQDEVVVDLEESSRRMNLISSRVGQYFMQRQNMEEVESKQLINAEYADVYCLGLAYFGILDTMCIDSKLTKCCIYALAENNIFIKQNHKTRLQDQSIFQLAIKGINPIFAQIILYSNIHKKYLHSLLLIYSIMESSYLRREQQDCRPAGVWRKSGYLHSCLDIIIKVQSLQKAHQSEALQSEEEENYFSVKALAEKYMFSISVYQSILRKYAKVLQLFNMTPKEVFEQIEDDEFHEILEILIVHFKGGVAFNSGSRRLGYFLKGKQSGILPHKSCLMRLLNERPSFILITRLMIDEGQPVIGTCNYIEDEVIISAYGAIPVTSKQSFGECEIEFQNISGSIFAHLSKYNSLQIQNFEREHECSLELSEQIGIISVQCSKLKQNSVREKFSNLIQQIKETYQKQARIVNYSKTLKVIIGSGGEIKQLSAKEGNEQLIQDTCIVTNLDPEVELADLKDLFDQFVQIKEIKVINKRNQNQAIITFYSFEDYKIFFGYFQGCVYLGRSMILNPYVAKIIQVLPEKFLIFEWNHWKSKGEANIVMENEVSAKKALKIFRQLGYKAQQSEEIVFVSGLTEITDERDLEMMTLGCGKIKQIQILRYCSKKAEEDFLIERMVSETFKGDDVKYTSEVVNKGKNGYRSKRVKFEKDDVMKQAYFLMNQIVGRIGTGRLYATPIFTYPVKLPNQESYIPVYEEIIQEVSEQMNRAKPIETEILNERDNKYIIIKANQDAEVDLIVNFLSEKLQGAYLNINIEDQSLLFTDMAMKKIMSLEKKFVCKFTFEFIEKKIKVLSRTKNINFIQKQINTKLVEEFVCPIPMYVNAYRRLKINYEEIKKSHPSLNNVKFEFEGIAKTIILTGRIEYINKAKNDIEKIVKAMRKKSQNIDENDQYCALCCEEFTHPFKLQSCGHKFCFECLQSTIRVTLKDLSMYPIKCPECMEKIFVSDLNCLCTEKDWKQIIKMSVNHFVYSNPSLYSFCYTVSCPQINIIQGSWFRCRECKKGYCLSCKGNYHPGMSCEQNRYGSDRMFKQYMNQIGGRVCANKSCKAPIVRIDGCFKVQCTRCKKCMCFKCPEQAMEAYNTPTEAYEHLDKKHGGCF